MKLLALVALLFVAIDAHRPDHAQGSRLRANHEHQQNGEHGVQHGQPPRTHGRPAHPPRGHGFRHHDSSSDSSSSEVGLVDIPTIVNETHKDGFMTLKLNVKGVPTITFCNTTSTPLIINSYTISPDDIEPDEDVKVTLHTTLTETVTSGTIKVNAKVDKFPILSETYDLCTEIQQAGLSCPLSPQNYDITETIDIPSIPISGTVDATAVLYDQSNNELACVEMVCDV